MKSIKPKVIQEAITKSRYTVSDAMSGNIPKVAVTDNEVAEDLIFEMVEDTEQYRIAKMVDLMGSEDDGKNLNKIIVYLLKSWSLLSPDQCAKVINEANRIIGARSYDADVRAKMANDLRAFMVSMRKTKGGVIEKSFEQLRHESDGNITVEVPI